MVCHYIVLHTKISNVHTRWSGLKQIYIFVTLDGRSGVQIKWKITSDDAVQMPDRLTYWQGAQPPKNPACSMTSDNPVSRPSITLVRYLYPVWGYNPNNPVQHKPLNNVPQSIYIYINNIKLYSL